MSEGLSSEFRQHFLGTHFFNPPRYMRLVEMVAGEATRGDVFSAMTGFVGETLGKGVVLCKDTPNFIANRIGVFSMMSVILAMLPDTGERYLSTGFL